MQKQQTATSKQDNSTTSRDFEKSSIFSLSSRHFIALGYSPIPQFRIEGKWHWPKGWSDHCVRLPTDAEMAKWARAPVANVAFCCGFGGLLAIDVDTDAPEIKAAVLDALPHCRIGRRGMKGFALLARYHGERIPNVYPNDDSRTGPVVEFKGEGQNITVPPSRHRKTNQRYAWRDPETNEPIEPPAAKDLPLLTKDDIERVLKALAPYSRAPRPQRPNLGNGAAPAVDIKPSRHAAWAEAGFRAATTNLAALREGRPTALFNGVCGLGWAVHHGLISRAAFEKGWLDACDANDLLQREGRRAIEATIRSGLDRSAHNPLPTLEDRAPALRVVRSGDFTQTPSASPSPANDDPKQRAGQVEVIETEAAEISNLELLTDAKGRVLKDARNFRLIAEHEMWRFRFNEFTDKIELQGLADYPRFDDPAFAKIRQHCASRYACKFAVQDLCEITSVVARESRIHPVRDYLNSLEWDGVERLDEWLHAYFGAENSAANRAIGRKTLIAAVRRMRRPGCQSKYMMVLEGEQDQGKSKALATLCPDSEWFTDNFTLDKHTDGKRVIEQTRGKWLIEISELDMRRGDSERIKAMLSRTVDEGRLSYGRERAEVPRSFIFIGTCNELMLVDTTGNVRFWPVKCSGKIDIEGISRDRDQLWAEAAYYEARGEPIHLTKDDEAEAKAIEAARQEREAGDELHNAIAAWALTDYPGGGIALRSIAEKALGVSPKDLDRCREMRIASALRKVGFEKGKSNGLSVWTLKTAT